MQIQTKASKNYGRNKLKVVSLTSWNWNAQNVPYGGIAIFTANFTSIFGGTLIFTFHGDESTSPLYWWNGETWGVADWICLRSQAPPRMPVEMVDEDAETKPPPQESTPKMASAPTPEAPKAGQNCGEGLGKRGDILTKVVFDVVFVCLLILATILCFRLFYGSLGWRQASRSEIASKLFCLTCSPALPIATHVVFE